MRSALFRIDSQQGGQLKLVGRGYGHGAGMSQLGAKTLADSYAWDYARILAFYYTDVELCSAQPSASAAEPPSCRFSRSRPASSYSPRLLDLLK
jgi:hypothetical protein